MKEEIVFVFNRLTNKVLQGVKENEKTIARRVEENDNKRTGFRNTEDGA